ncbi:hypothetical protein B5X24_HaOG211292 [Helicoverpa armigera]|uniref:Uncharacterized protein n=1 Tax=Helicoverpa armigera TaxID=29058 RepID=A0A2W1BD67_HELAM|nr:hypothetical protein B5X24_HaOG211292 [Helicoverpa armigera]
MEPPQIQVHPASNQPRKSPSRFSVTRNYDSVYNPTPTPPNSPAQPNIYAQLQNEVVTQLKHEALTQPKTELVAQTKNDSTQTKNEVVTQIRHDANIKCEPLSNEVLVKSELSESLDAQVKNEVHTQVKSEITTVKNESVVDLVQKPVKKVITAQVRSQAMKQSKLDQLNQVQSEPTVLVKSEVTLQSDSKPTETVKNEPSAQLLTEEITVKNNVTTQIKHEPNKSEVNAQTQDLSAIQAKNESVSTVKNVVTTQVHNEPISIKVESQIQVKSDQSNQATQKVESTSQVSNITENKSTKSEDNIVVEAQLKGFPIELLSHIGPTPQRNDTVTQFNTEADARQRKQVESAQTHTDVAKTSNIESRNETVTKVNTELVTQHRNIPVEPTSLVNIDEKPIQSIVIEPTIPQKNEPVTQTKIDLVTENKNLPVDSTSKSKIDIKDTQKTNVEHPIQVKNSSNTQLQTELVTQPKSIPVEPNIDKNCGIKETEIDRIQTRLSKLESEISTKTINLPVEQKQDKTIPVEPKDKTKVEPVSLKQIINTDAQLKTELPTLSESSSPNKPSIDSKTQLRDLLETSSKIKTSPSHSILPKTSIATIEESPECEEIELSDSDVAKDTQTQSTSDSKTKTNVECMAVVEHAVFESKTSIEPPKTELQNIETDKKVESKDSASSAQLENTQTKSDALRDKTDLNVIDLSIKSILVQSDLKYSDVVKSDKNTGVKTKVCSDKHTDKAMDNIVAITEDLGNIIKEMKVLVKNKNSLDETVPVDSVLLKKNKSESSLDSPDLEVSRLMEKRVECVFDSNSSLEISGSSMESLNEQNKTVQELDRRKSGTILSAEGSMESTSDVTPVNSGNFLNLSLSSNESVSPIFGKTKLIHDSLSSLEASVSSLDSAKHDRVMVTSADSGIEYSLQQPSENRDDNSSNEGTLTNNSSLRETVRKPEAYQIGDTIASSPKRASSLLDVPALKNKGLDRMRKISWVAPSSSFHIPRPEEKEAKPSHLEKLLSLFQHPSSIFSRSLTSDDEKKSTSSTPPRKDSSLTSSFWSWGSTIEKDREEDSSEATDSTLSERVQVSFVDESFSRKLDSKTPSTDTDNTLSEFQSFPTQESESVEERVTKTTEDIIVQNLDLSVISNTKRSVDSERMKDDLVRDGQENAEKEIARPRSFAAVLKSSGSENSLDKQNSPDSGQPVDKLPSKVIRGIKENISPENTLTSSMTNTKALAVELERQVKYPNVSEAIKNEPKVDEIKTQSDLAPIATIEETEDDNPLQLAYIDDVKVDSDITIDTRVAEIDKGTKIEGIDLGKDALSYLIYENRDFEVGAGSVVKTTVQQGSLAEELKQAEIKEIIDLSPELVVEENVQEKVFTAKEIIGLRTSPIIPERAKLKKSNSLEELSQLSDETSPKTKTIVFKVPESTTSTPRDIPERRSKLRTRSGSSPKSLPESLNKPCPLTKMESILSKKKKKVSSLGKIARDSLLALNMSEEEIAEFRRSYKLTSVESLKSLESVSESGNSVDSRCRACLRHSQESLMSLDSISEDCRCTEECEKPGKSTR